MKWKHCDEVSEFLIQKSSLFDNPSQCRPFNVVPLFGELISQLCSKKLEISFFFCQIQIKEATKLNFFTVIHIYMI